MGTRIYYNFYPEAMDIDEAFNQQLPWMLSFVKSMTAASHS